jgi:hypothetical protein
MRHNRRSTSVLTPGKILTPGPTPEGEGCEDNKVIRLFIFMFVSTEVVLFSK